MVPESTSSSCIYIVPVIEENDVSTNILNPSTSIVLNKYVVSKSKAGTCEGNQGTKRRKDKLLKAQKRKSKNPKLTKTELKEINKVCMRSRYADRKEDL